MTKKILISLDDLKRITETAYNTGAYKSTHNLLSLHEFNEAWFHLQPAAPQWVAAAYDTPDYEKEVFVRTDSGHIFNARLRYEGCWWDIAKDDAVVLDVITHWMEIPELPEKNE